MRFRLFGFLGPLVLAKPDSRSAAVLGDEFDAGFFKHSSDFMLRWERGAVPSELKWAPDWQSLRRTRFLSVRTHH